MEPDIAAIDQQRIAPAEHADPQESGEDTWSDNDRFLVLAGELTREEFGEGYDQLIREMALERASGNIALGESNRAASFCGFQKWEDVETLLASEEPAAELIRTDLEELAATSLSAAEKVTKLVDDAWWRDDCVQVVDFEAPEDGRDWLESRGYGAEKGLLVFQTATKVGDRGFRLHFDSSRFPSLEWELMVIQSKKDALWERMGAVK